MEEQPHGELDVPGGAAGATPEPGPWQAQIRARRHARRLADRAAVCHAWDGRRVARRG